MRDMKDIFNDKYDLSSAESLNFEKIAINLDVASSMLLGFSTGHEVGKRIGKERVSLDTLRNQEMPNIEGGYYSQVDNIAKHLNVLFTPISVIYVLPDNGGKVVTLDIIENSEMNEEMKNAYRSKDKLYFRKLFLNKMILETNLAEQYNSKKLLASYKQINRNVTGKEKRASEDIYSEIVDFVAFSNMYENLSEKAQGVFNKLACDVHNTVVLQLERPISDYSELGKEELFKLANVKSDKKLQNDLLNVHYIKKNLKIGFVGNRVVYSVDGNVLGQLNTLSMSPESFKKFKNEDKEYFKDLFLKESKKSGLVKKASVTASSVEDLFTKSDMPAKAYYCLLNNKFKTEWLDYDTEYLIKAIETAFNLTKPISTMALDKIFMIQNICNNLDCLKNSFLFEKACRTLNNKPIDFEDFEYGLTIGEIVNALQILDELTPDNDIFDDLSEEVMTYITKSLVLSDCRCVYPNRKIISSELEDKFFKTLNNDITYRWATLNIVEVKYQKIIQPLVNAILTEIRKNGVIDSQETNSIIDKMISKFRIKNQRVINLTRDNVINNLAVDIMLDTVEKDVDNIMKDLNI